MTSTSRQSIATLATDLRIEHAVREAFAYERNWTEICEPQYSDDLGWVQMNISWGRKEVVR
jgi:hypothetical protein